MSGLSKAELQAMAILSATLPKIAMALERIAVHADRIAEALEGDDEESFEDEDEEEDNEGGE